MPVRRAAAVLLALLAGAAPAGCGRGSEDRPDRPATLVLDFQPNAVHTGIFLALQRDFDDAEGVGLRVQVPSSSTDAVKLLIAGGAQFAILDTTSRSRASAAATSWASWPSCSARSRPCSRSPASGARASSRAAARA